MEKWTRSVLIATLLAMACASRTASADEGEAEAVFREARALTAEGRYGEACPKLARSYALDPATGTLFYLADCLDRIGKVASALPKYVAVAKLARAAGQTERADYADARIAALTPRVPTLTLGMSAGVAALPGLRVTVDGEPAPELVTRPRGLDVAKHSITVSATGKKTWIATVDVEQEGARITLVVPDLEDASLSVIARPIEPGSSHAMRNAGFAIGAAGLVGAGIGAVAGIVAVAKNGSSNAGCDATGVCDAAGFDERRGAITAARVSTIAFAVGGALTAAGVVLLIAAPSGRSSASARVELVPAGARVGVAW